MSPFVHIWLLPKAQTCDWTSVLWWLALPCLAGQTLGPLVLPEVVRPERFLGCTCCKVVSSVYRGSETKDSHSRETQMDPEHHPEVHGYLRLVLLRR